MKLIHTPLGTLASRKKIIAGVAALALVGGIAPTLINDTHADQIDGLVVLSNVTEPIYTTVGPGYYTSNFTDLWNYLDDGYTANIADRSIADFYTNDEMSGPVDHDCENIYSYIQGKKIGETEIVLEKAGEETVSIPLISVKLTPEYDNVLKLGKQIEATGSIEGADDSLLRLVHLDTHGVVDALQTGERSFKLSSIQTENWDWNSSAYATWSIGNQDVYGGTYYMFLPVEGIDNVYGLSENEEVLESAILELMAAIQESDWSLTTGNEVTTKDGSIFHFTNSSDDYDYEGRLQRIQGILDYNDASVTQAEKK